MECEWTVDEDDGCTLRLQCVLKDACDTNECYDLDMLLDKAMHAPRRILDSKVITGPSANLTDLCSTKCGKICANIEPVSWSDYMPHMDTTPIVDNYIYPLYISIANILSDYLIAPANNWLAQPANDYILTPIYDFILSPIWQFIWAALLTVYDYLPSPEFSFLYNWADMYTVEFLVHFLASIVSIAALVIVLFVYFCYVFTDKAKFGVVTRHPLKERVPDQAYCSPTCAEKHTHRRDSTTAFEPDSRFSPGVTSRRRKGSQDLHRKMTQIAQAFDSQRRFSESDEYRADPGKMRDYLEDDWTNIDHMARDTCVQQ